MHKNTCSQNKSWPEWESKITQQYALNELQATIPGNIKLPNGEISTLAQRNDSITRMRSPCLLDNKLWGGGGEQHPVCLI